MKLIVAALIAAQAVAGTEAAAASLDTETRLAAQRTGAFAGARFRVPFGGAESGKARATLAVAPSFHGQKSDGSLRTRYGAGMELSLTGWQNAQLSLAGTPVSQLAAGRKGPDGEKLGVSTTGWLAIGIGGIVLAIGTLYVLADARCGDDCD
jgi:hypothetical protein